MGKKNILIWLIHLLFLIGGLLVGFFIPVSLSTYWGTKEREVFKDLNNVLQLKFKNDTSFAEYCSEEGHIQINNNWPTESNSFFAVIDDYSFGSYECRVFFDTGDVFYAEMVEQKGFNKLTQFAQIKWPNRKEGESSWKVMSKQ